MGLRQRRKDRQHFIEMHRSDLEQKERWEDKHRLLSYDEMENPPATRSQQHSDQFKLRRLELCEELIEYAKTALNVCPAQNALEIAECFEASQMPESVNLYASAAIQALKRHECASCRVSRAEIQMDAAFKLSVLATNDLNYGAAVELLEKYCPDDRFQAMINFFKQSVSHPSARNDRSVDAYLLDEPLEGFTDVREDPIKESNIRFFQRSKDLSRTEALTHIERNGLVWEHPLFSVTR